MITKQMKSLATRYYNLSLKLTNHCRNFLSELLKANNGIIDWEDVELPSYVSVCYDGGNHPEYASNVFSEVYGVMLEDDGDIYLHIEDCEEYPISSITVDELYNICDFIDKYAKEMNINIPKDDLYWDEENKKIILQL